jgi:hypothetical protein
MLALLVPARTVYCATQSESHRIAPMAYLDLFKYLSKDFKGLLLSQGFVVTPKLLARVAPEMLPDASLPTVRAWQSTENDLE